MPIAHIIVLVACVVFGVLINVFGVRWQYKYAHRLLNGWARRKNYEVVEREYRWLRLGPYWWAAGCPVFRVVVISDTGQERSGWVRCGTYPGSVMFSDQVRVTWDDRA
jgi:hypothetical protein